MPNLCRNSDYFLLLFQVLLIIYILFKIVNREIKCLKEEICYNLESMVIPVYL